MSGLFDPTWTAAAEAQGNIGPAHFARCNVAPADLVIARRCGRKSGGEGVAIGMIAGQARASVILTPAEARRFAAAMLTAADESDGTVPLIFHPPSPEGVEPRR